jgi:hypothetical protein
MQVDWGKNIFLDRIAFVDEEICAESLPIAGRDEVIESNETLLKFFWWVIVEASEYDGENGREILLDSGTRKLVIGLRSEVNNWYLRV